MIEDDDNPTVELCATSSGGDVRGVLPFARIIDMVGAANETDLVNAIEEDARALLELGLGAYVDRYAEAIDLARHPRARAAVLRAHAESLRKIRGFDEDRVEQLASRAIDAARSPREAGATPGAGGTAGDGRGPSRRLRPTRSAFTMTIAIPIVLVLTFLFGSGFAVATLYWLGYVSTAREVQLQQQILAQEAERLAEEAESIAEAKNRAADEAILWIDAMMAEAIEENMEEIHLVNAYEILMATEQVAQRFHHDPTQLERIDRIKLDEVVMPTLRLVYRVDELGGEETMQEVRELLMQLHERPRIEDVPDEKRPDDLTPADTSPTDLEGTS